MRSKKPHQKKKKSSDLPSFKDPNNYKNDPRNKDFTYDEPLEKNQTQGDQQYNPRRNRQTGSHGFNKQKRSFGMDRINQLKDMIDNIISDCKTENRNVREGLQYIKQYQAQVLQQLQQNNEQSQHSSNQLSQKYSEKHYPNSKSSIPVKQNRMKISEQIAWLRQQNYNLNKQLQDEIRKNNELSKNYKKIESVNAKLKKELQKSTNRGNNRIEETENQNESIINKLRSDQRPLYKLERENAKLKQEVARLYQFKKDEDQIQSLKQELFRRTEDLAVAEEQIERLTKKINSDAKKFAQITKQLEQKNIYLQQQLNLQDIDNLIKQFNLLKQQNEQLRIQTIQLLKRKTETAQNNDVQMLQNEIMILHDNIQKQNIAKKKFFEEVSNYKKHFLAYENQNKLLKQKNQELHAQIKRLKDNHSYKNHDFTFQISRNQYSNKPTNTYQYKNQTSYYSKPDPIMNKQEAKQPTSTYEQMANVLLDNEPNNTSKLQKFKSVLTDLRNVRSQKT